MVFAPDYATAEPLFPLDGPERSEVLEKRANVFRESSPLKLEELSLRIAPYGYGPTGLNSAFCRKIAHLWAQTACSDMQSPIYEVLGPSSRHFWLIDSQSKKPLNANWFGNTDRDLIRSLIDILATKQTNAVWKCEDEKDRARMVCFAARALGKQLVVVWALHREDQFTLQEQSDREGKAIAALISYGMGAEEKYGKLLSALEKLKP